MSLAELSSEYGIAKSTIGGWVKDVREIKPKAAFAKKAMAIFAKEMS